MPPLPSLASLGLAVLLQVGPSSAAEPAPGGAIRFTFACGPAAPCYPKAGPGPADRAVHPFEGTLGRPCGYRWRPTPEGTRKVRMCF